MQNHLRAAKAAEELAGEPLFDRLLEILHALLAGHWACWLRGNKVGFPASLTLSPTQLEFTPTCSNEGSKKLKALGSRLGAERRWLVSSHAQHRLCCIIGLQMGLGGALQYLQPYQIPLTRLPTQCNHAQANLREVPAFDCRQLHQELASEALPGFARRAIQAALTSAPSVELSKPDKSKITRLQSTGWQLPMWQQQLAKLACIPELKDQHNKT